MLKKKKFDRFKHLSESQSEHKSKKTMPRHIILKPLKKNVKKKVLKAPREKNIFHMGKQKFGNH